MEKIIPSYYEGFRCTASECEDNCCIGWEIDVDCAALEKYREWEETGEFSILEHIGGTEEEAHFVLGEEERCPFLNESNLCRLQLAYGEEALCRICRLHPRFFNEYGSHMEIGLDLCCEEAARLILSQGELPVFRTQKENLESEFWEEEPFYQLLAHCRNRIFSYLREATNPMETIIAQLMAYCESVEEEILFGCETEKIKQLVIGDGDCFVPESSISHPTKEYYAEGVNFLRNLLPLSVSWHNFLADVAADLDEVWEKRDEFHKYYPYFSHHARHLLHHYTYRYLMEAVWDGSVFCRFFAGVFIVQMTELLDVAWYYYQGNFSFADQVRICTQMSKEIEYSEENLEALFLLGQEGGREAGC